MRLRKQFAAFLLAVMILINLLPAVSAVDDDSVLTSIGHSDTDTVTLSGSDRDVTLTVPYAYSGTTVDLANGLILTYDESLYQSVVAAPASQAAVDGAAVTVMVTFNDIEDADDAAKSATNYYVRIVRAEATPASFSGIISKTVEYPAPGAVSLTASEFTDLYEQNDGEALGSISISGSNLVAGTLKYNGANYVFDTPVDASDLSLFSFTASAYGEVSYDINAYGAGTSALIGTAVLTITVYSAPEMEREITESVYLGASQYFSASDFTSCCDLFGMELTSVEITPTNTEYGTWYLGTTEINAAKEITAANITRLHFTGAATGTATFEWRIANAAGYSDYGTGSVTVSAPTIALSAYTSSTTLAKGSVWTISASNFSYSPSSVDLTYLKISTIPAAADGYLYLTTALSADSEAGYAAIKANTALTAGAVIPYGSIKYLRLSTKSTSTNTSVSFKWTATFDSQVSSATWADEVSYTVKYITGGTVSYSTYANVPVTLSASDFSSKFASSSGYSLSYVTFTLPAKTSGVFYYNYSLTSMTGTSVSASTKYYVGSSPNLSYLTFVPAKDYSGTVSVSYKAYRSDSTYFTGTLNISVSSCSGGTVIYTTDKNAGVQVDAAEFSQSFFNATGETLSYVKFTLPSSSYGKLYYDYVSDSDYDATVSSTKKYYVYSESYLSYVSFVPHDDYTGTVVINYTAYDEDGDDYSGKLIVFVVDSPAGIVSYTSKVNGTVNLSGEDFADEFISVTGSVLYDVQFTLPAATSGILYYNYSAETATGTKVSASTKYYNGATPDLSDISFVPAKDFTGEVVVKYTVYTVSGASYAGKLKIKVGEGSSGVVYYETDLNTAVGFRASDFSSKFYVNSGGSTLSYVTFTLPSSSYGKLYDNYTSSTSYGSAVTAGTKYYVGASPYLSDITFVPKTGYSGSFTVTYTGYDADGTGCSGKIHITVDSDEDTVSYQTTSQDAVTFSASDFSGVLEENTGETMKYVKFDLPSSSYGVLYYGYSSSTSDTSLVSYTTKYYVSASPYLSRVTFVPDSDFTGTVKIYYTAYDTDGGAYDDTMLITVTGADGGTVNYDTVMNTPVTLDPDDFYNAFEDETGCTLSYVKFTLPSASCGTLYYGYTSATNFTSKVSSSTKYYRTTSPRLSYVTFVPDTDYWGEVSIRYAAYTSSGDSYTGELIIDVVIPFSDLGTSYSWAVPAVSYLYNHSIVEGTGDGQFHPGDSMSRGDFILMIYRAFDLQAAASDNFSDVSAGSYYYEAIAAAKALGIVEGIDGSFHPKSYISRQDAMVIIQRLLEMLGTAPETGDRSDLSGYSDADSVSNYAVEAVATLVKAGIITGNEGKLNPKAVMSRAEMAVILYRVLNM